MWVAAPGEGVITTYPFGLYAAGWGTSFSSPYGRRNRDPRLEHAIAGHSEPGRRGPSRMRSSLGSNMGYGRLNVYWTLSGDESSSGSASLGGERRSDADDGQSRRLALPSSPTRIEALSEALPFLDRSGERSAPVVGCSSSH